MALITAYRYIPTEKLILRPITLVDAPAIFHYTSDPRVARFTHWNAHSTLDETIQYIHHIQQRTNTHVWGIELQDSKLLIGECSITHHEDGRAELSYALAYNHWGNGYATQALTALLAIAEEDRTIKQIEAWIISNNRASCRVAQKAGMQISHTIDRAWILDQTTVHDIVIYSK